MRIAIIPARAGSKRIPRKNIRHFCGKPMIAYSIEKALASGLFDQVIVSTDSQEIADIAIQCGASVPFLRPTHLSDDYTGTIPVISHAIEWYEKHSINISIACCIYATAPLLCIDDLKQGLQLLKEKNADYVFSVTQYPYPIQRALKLTENGNIAMLFPEHYNTRSQDLEKAYHDAGQFYWGSATAWLQQKSIFSADSYPLILSREHVQDIDTQEDWNIAEKLFFLFNKQ